jgi:hypothetical protein
MAEHIDFYIAVSVVAGAVQKVEPESAYTKAVQKPYMPLGEFLNKMVEYHYRVVPGICIPLEKSGGIILMQRGE